MIKSKIEGVTEMNRLLLQLPHELSSAVLIAALKEGAEPIRADASSNAPRRAGSGPHLADHIVTRALGEIRATEIGVEADAAVIVGPTKDFFWGYFNEFGTSKQPARPWFRPAFDTNEERSLRAILTALWFRLLQATKR